MHHLESRSQRAGLLASAVIVGLACLAFAGPALAQGVPGTGDNVAATGDSTTSVTPEQLSEISARIAEISAQNERLRQENEVLREDLAFNEQRLEGVLSTSERLTGYVDVGFFYVEGDGSGIRPDFGNRNFPEYDGVVAGPWVLMGDPLSTAVNALGEPADTGGSIALTSDSIDASSKPTFILNSVSLSIFRGVRDDLSLEGTVHFMPRSRDYSDAGSIFTSDYFAVSRAYLNYIVPVSTFDLHVYAGKFDSVLGREYRTQDAPDRITVTPSLICRYTCGHPIGIKARARFLDRALIINAALTNGSHIAEIFPFRDEIDSNRFKTAAARLSYQWPVGAGLELAASGSYGAQDLHADDGIYQWHIGVDLFLDWRNFLVTAEFVRGNVPGETEDPNAPCDVAACLDYKGAYALLGYRARRGWIPYLRIDWRDAVQENGSASVYLSEVLRATGGVRKEFGHLVAVKAEYTLNRELGRIPQAPNNVLTSSLVVRY